MITVWEVPFILRSSTLGDLLVNTAIGDVKYVLVPASCDDRIPLRVVHTEIPAADGEIPNCRYKGSFRTQLAIQLRLATGGCPDAQDTVEMTDDLMGWLDSTLNDAGRLLWTPYPGYGDNRMYDEMRWEAEATWSLDDGGFSRITFGLDSPFPYAIDATQQTITVTAAGNTLTNTGNTTHWPVLKVFGPTSAFVIENTTIGQQIEYDSSLPGAVPIGAGDYVEIDTFRNTMYLNGSGANRKPGLVIESSDFWGLIPGVNALDSNGPTFDVLFNPPWV